MVRKVSTLKFWTAVGAVGTGIGGISALVETVGKLINKFWIWFPNTNIGIWNIVAAAGIGIGVISGLIAVLLAARQSSPELHERYPGEHATGETGVSKPNRRALYAALTVLLLATTVGAVFLYLGGYGEAAEKIDDLARNEPKSRPKPKLRQDASLDEVCSTALRKFHKRSLRPQLPGAAGLWTGWTSWTSDEEQWTLQRDGTLQLTHGQQGGWREDLGNRPAELTIGFPKGTWYRARLYGQLICGVRFTRRRDTVPSGNFQFVLLQQFEHDGAPSNDTVAGNFT
ncbi:hypothetical protein [Sphingomonas sp.]|uniref:hypothetical protein n=1 Tax=Sphingomonas sp. TaxID=28214 RepID=UPI001B25A591|nr:hypothetical protein [Sphingomonas sp.]MBO9714086.1 hypothetical protein [Sphingomonas sp.]